MLKGVPPHAWDYRLGNRSEIDWVLDQHKERKPKDATIPGPSMDSKHESQGKTL